MASTLYRRFRVPIFWTALAVAYLLAIMPSSQAPSLGGGDKVDHITAFVVLTMLGRCAYPRRPRWQLATALSLFGVLIELTQAIPIIGRDASVLDWIADSVAILAALLLLLPVEKFFPALFEE